MPRIDLRPADTPTHGLRRARLLYEGADTGLAQMQRDQQDYSRFDASQTTPRLRFYAWSEPTVSLGRFQQPAPDFAARLAELGLPSVQRPTGGRAILHAGDLTFSLIGPPDWLPGSLLAGHALFSRALAHGLAHLGLIAGAGSESASRNQPVHCFASATPADLLVAGGKLIGTAQVRRRQAFLIQGTIYLQADHALLRALFGEPSETRSQLLDLAQLLGQPPNPAQVAQALAAGLQEVLNLDYLADELSPA